MYVPRKLGAIPKSQLDETLSSFLIRTAHKHGLCPHSFCRFVWPEYQFWTRDIDRCSNVCLIDAIAMRTGLSSCQVEQLTFRPLMQKMTGKIRCNGISRWILPIGVYHRIRRNFGQRFCPECLADPIPFVRRTWRLGYTSFCEKHLCALIDACPVCDHPFIPHRHDCLLLARCHHCNHRLSKNTNSKIDLQLLKFQQKLDALLHSDFQTSEEFDCWHRLLSILARIDERFEHQAGGWFSWRQIERNRLFSCAYNLHQGWPESFIEWAEIHHISQAYLNHEGQVNGWFGSAVQMLPERYRARRETTKKVKQEEWISKLAKSSETIECRKNTRAKVLLDVAMSISNHNLLQSKIVNP